jgi:hypothetical protein
MIERYLARDDLPPELVDVAPAARRSAYIVAGIVARGAANLDDDRWAVRDRLGAGGVVGGMWVGFQDTAVDQVERLVEQLEEKEAMIRSLASELDARAEVIEVLDAAVRDREARLAELDAALRSHVAPSSAHR